MALTNVSSKYGAPMGRVTDTTNTQAKCRLYHIRLNSGGYDSGGAYWGQGDRLYCCEGDDFVRYTRATDRKDAKEKMLKFFPELTFIKN